MGICAKSLCEHVFSCLLDRYQRVELLSYGKFMLNFLRNCQTIFQSGHTLLHSHQHVWGLQFHIFPTLSIDGYKRNVLFLYENICNMAFFALAALKRFLHILVHLFLGVLLDGGRLL